MSTTINDILTDVNEAQARVGELVEAITGAVDDDSNLDELDSTSKTAEYNLWKFVFAAICFIQEGIVNEALAEMQVLVNSGVNGIDPWFQAEIFKFQYGDALSFNTTTKKYYYTLIDATKQIIKRCSITTIGGLTTIKVATESAGNPVALSAPQLVALKSYVDKIMWSGSNVDVKSLDSDKINSPMTVYYDGTIILTDLQALVEAAYSAYLANLPFNGQYSITKHQDAIQAVPNVNDVVMGTIQAKPNSGIYSTVVRIYLPISGYIEKDPTIPLSTMITYVPQ